jgi:long-chain acyl-CoA synthetase
VTFAGRIAKERPDEIALRDPERTWTWAQADAWLRPAVNALVAADLGEHRRVAILAHNSGETLLAYVACTLAGASAVAVNSHLTASEAAYVLRDSAAALVMCDSTTAQVALDAAREAGVETVVAHGRGALPPRVLRLAGWGTNYSEPRTDVTPRRTLVYTSGTTGRPKGVELPPTSWVGGADVVEHVARLSEHSMVARGRHLVVGPMYHSGPLTSTRLFLGGAPVTVLGKFDASGLLDAIERDRISSSIMVPTHFQRLLALPEDVRAGRDLSSLSFVLQVGAKCPDPVKHAMIEWWGADVLFESYGASEVGTTCMISASEWLERPGSVGRAVPPFEAFVRGDDGTHLPPGTEGPLWFRDTTGFGIRYASGDRTSTDDGEFTLGEIGRMDSDGYVWITDRFSDMVVSGGVNIYPAEVERALSTMPDVADIACFGRPDPEFGERLVAFVVPRDTAAPPSIETIAHHARASLAGYKVPKEVFIVDALPRTAVGKLDKRAMRHMDAGDPLITPTTRG